MKKFFIFLLSFIPWFLSNLFMSNTTFYKSLELPIFAPPSWLFAVVWPILYFLIAFSIYIVYTRFGFSDKYKYTLILNYVFNQSFTLLFFNLENIILGAISTILTLITAILLYKETNELNKKTSYLLIPYILWLIFASILSISILFLN